MPPGRSPQPLRILVASGDLLLTRRLGRALVEDERLVLVGIAASADEAVELARTLCPDLVVVDESLPPSGPLAALEAIAGVSDARAILLVDELPELDWESESAAVILAFAARDRAPSELAALTGDVAGLALALELQPS